MVETENRPAPTATGRLERTPVVNLLLYLLERKLGGTLEFTTTAGERALFLFAAGQPAKAKTTEPVAYLGRVLLELGFIEDDTYRDSLHDLANGMPLHGQILLNSGAITEAQLRLGLKVQLQRKLVHTSTFGPDTTFAYFDGVDGLQGYGGDDLVPVDPFPLVWTLLRQAPPGKTVTATVERLGTMALRVSRAAQLERFDFSPHERGLVDLLRARSLRAPEFIDSGVLKPQDAQLLLYCLLLTKQVKLAQDGSLPPPPHAIPAGDRPSQVLINAERVEMLAPSEPPDVATRRDEIRVRLATLDNDDYFVLLGVDIQDPPDRIRERFFELAKKWHPDRLAASLADQRDAVARIFSCLTLAYSTLTDPEQRQRYLRRSGSEASEDTGRFSVVTVVEASTAFQKAEASLRRNDFVQAELYCRSACQLDPDRPPYMALLAWLDSMKPENQTPKAMLALIERLGQAIDASDRCEGAFFYRGMLHKRLGNDRQAQRDFARAAELNPRNIDAAREVLLFQKRVTKGSIPAPPPKPITPPNREPKAKQGLFAKLFKK
jgi:curved DNA-binding protein CbpA